MSKRERHDHHCYVHYYIYNGKPDGFCSVVTEEYTYRKGRCQYQEAEGSHQQAELRQTVWRVPLHKVETLDIGNA